MKCLSSPWLLPFALRMTQLHPLASFDCQRRHLLGRDLGNEFGNAAGDLDPVLIKLALPKQARQHRAA
jgi:hypothetical protein